MKRFCVLILIIALLCLSSCARKDEANATAIKPTDIAQQPIVSVNSQVITTAPTVGQAPEATPEIPNPPPPVKIELVDMGITADIQPVGKDNEGRMDTIPSADIVAWYEPGSSPGGPGNSILAGHRVWKGKKGKFEYIKDLVKEDEVIIEYQDGKRESFLVTDTYEFSLDEAPDWIMDLGGEPHTTLITCAGTFQKTIGTSDHRYIVVMKRKDQI